MQLWAIFNAVFFVYRLAQYLGAFFGAAAVLGVYWGIQKSKALHWPLFF